ncbi:acetyl-CoA C-acyltransferase [Nocardia sp. NPDC050712]|uniref:thiolase family protein n=1 Tax=Nocardia sp. NPDC050712 TaxID=3155518 RepID=UPI0034046A71
MRDAVIVEAVRTAIGRGKPGGALAGVHPVDLSAQVLQDLEARTGLDAAGVDDVIWGCVSQVGEQAADIARYAVLAAGWPESVPGVTVDRQCGSSQQAVHQAAAGVIAGQYDIVVAGGVESMSRIPMGAAFVEGKLGIPFSSGITNRYPGVVFNQGVSAEMIAAEYGLSRTEVDEHALESHARAAAAIDAGRFAAQISPVTVRHEDGTQHQVTVDEGVRRDGTPETLARLRTSFAEDGVVTAANASQISDGAAAILVTTSEIAAANGWTPLARFHTGTVLGVDPVTMLKGPIPATAKVLDRAGLRISDIGAFEINEAFASVTLAWLRETGVEPELLNPNGGAIALGHPLGASGARLMTTLLHHMRDNNIRYGLQAMCEGGGQANATVLELL